MVHVDKNALDLNHLEEELELLLKQNLPTANTPPTSQNPNQPATSTASKPSASASINNAKQTLKDLVKQTNAYAEQSINSTNYKEQNKAASKPFVNTASQLKNAPPTVDTINLNDLYIESTHLNTTSEKHETLPTKEISIAQNDEEIETAQHIHAEEGEEVKLDTDVSITKGLEDFFNEHESTFTEETTEPEVSLIHNAYANEKSSIFSPIFNNIKLIALGFISLATAFIYYLYVYQPYAPSVVYADKTPYKTKNMIENLENQNIVNSSDLTHKNLSTEENTLPVIANKINENITVKQPFIKPIEKPYSPVKRADTNNNVPQKHEVIEAPKQKVETKEEPKSKIKKEPKVAIPAKIVKIELPKKPFTEKDQEFDSEIEPQVKNIVETKPKFKPKTVTKKNYVAKNKPIITKKLDPWEANQLRKLHHFGYYIQLASSPALSDATHLQSSYNTKYKNILDGKHIMIKKSSLINNRIYYRLRIKAANLEKARAICLKIKNMGGQCIFGKK